MENIDLGHPFYVESSSPAPPQQTRIGKYVIHSSLLPQPTKCSYIYHCYDTEENKKKVIKFIKFFQGKVQRIVNEVEIMKSIRHPNIIKLEDYFRYGPYMSIVIPYAPHRSVLTLLIHEFKNGGMPEEMAAVFMYQMLKAVDFLHGMNIWHRDIKLDNFLLFDSDPDDKDILNNTNNANNNENNDQNNDTNNNPDLENSKTLSKYPKVVLCDFGFAKRFPTKEKSTQFMGTPQFMAPEIVNNEPYDNSVDIWALGISLFMMITGRYPFNTSKTDPRYCFRYIRDGDLKLRLVQEMNKSVEVFDLLNKMLQFDPSKRITAHEALKDPWIMLNVSDQNKSQTENTIIDVLGIGTEYLTPPST